jgi:hypothetical protein
MSLLSRNLVLAHASSGREREVRDDGDPLAGAKACGFNSRLD